MPAIWMDVDTALAEVPINISSLVDDADFKSREESVTFDQAGLDLVWQFTTTAGVVTQTAVTPTDTAGDYDWVNQGNGMYTIEIPSTGGASINNNTEGFGQFIGFATGVLPWVGPIIGFRAAALNNSLVDGGGNLDVNVTLIEGSDATDTLGVAQTGDSFARIGAAGVGLTDVTDRLPSALIKGTADSGTTLTLVDAALDQADDDWWRGSMVRFTSGTLDGQTAMVTGFTASSDTIAFYPAVTTAVVTHDYELLPMTDGMSQVIADEVWDEPQALHAASSTFGGMANETADAAVGAAIVQDKLDALFLVTSFIDTLTSQTQFKLLTGSVDNDVYNGHTCVVIDVSSGVQKSVARVTDYIGATKELFLAADPGIFTVAPTDRVYILTDIGIKPTVANRTLDVTANGNAGIDWGNVENKGSTVDLSATDIQLATLADGAHGGAAATITAKAITVLATDAGQAAVQFVGNTTGAGLSVSGGTSGTGIKAVGGSSAGDGILASSPTADDISGDLSGSIATIATDGITATSMATGSISEGTIHADELTNIENEILDAGEIDHNIADTIGKNIRNAADDSFSNATALAGLNDLSLSDLRTVFGINASNVLDELSQGAPSTNPSLGAAVMANYMALVHKYVVNSSTNFKEVHNAAGTKIFKKALTDSASVFTEAKAITGA